MQIRSPGTVCRELAELHGIPEDEVMEKLRTGEITLPVDPRTIEEQVIDALTQPVTDHPPFYERLQ